MLRLLIQAVLYLGSVMLFGVVSGPEPSWLGAVSGLGFFALAWIVYRVGQACFPDWWPPGEDGLSKGERMLNTFMPPFIIYVMTVLLGFCCMQPVREAANRIQQERQTATESSKENTGRE